ncbi:MAG: hypothetical protein H7A21_14900 [Spirochaetales bacterium]|nr:hypothetical protein [Leptospiraceae bacterium]MCP5482722.1 hypothetical protein [Spirochaetales bacterium]MCP5485216.1 hypothetical protein [Spirochaetales bacterium]
MKTAVRGRPFGATPSFFFMLLGACMGLGGSMAPALAQDEIQEIRPQFECDQSCVQIRFHPRSIDQRLGDLLERNAASVLVDFGDRRLRLNSPELEDLLNYARGIKKRNGTVIIEPIIIHTREFDIPFVTDIVDVSYTLFSRTYEHFKYAETENYHAKLLYDPSDGSLRYAYFIHRRFGDPCVTLYSRCDVIEYLDDETFDRMLSDRLTAAGDRPIRVVFENTNAYMPNATLSLENLNATNDSVRLYKWLLAAESTESRALTNERFLSLELAVSIIKYTIQAYDFVRALALYRPATDRTATITYIEEPNGARRIESVVFTR